MELFSSRSGGGLSRQMIFVGLHHEIRPGNRPIVPQLGYFQKSEDELIDDAWYS